MYYDAFVITGRYYYLPHNRDLLVSTQEKLAYFRIKELKDVLTHLGLSKQGKKQVRTQINLQLFGESVAYYVSYHSCIILCYYGCIMKSHMHVYFAGPC